MPTPRRPRTTSACAHSTTSGRRLWGISARPRPSACSAGVRTIRPGPKDVASFHPYDDFIIAIMMQLEMLGFCKRGQGCGFINEHDLTHTGDLPLNTGGGPNVVEAIRQLFGEGGKRQVKDTRNALVTGIGGIPYGRNWMSSVVMILTPDA